MSYQSNWGYQDNCNEYGKPLPYVKEVDETTVNYEFLTSFHAHFPFFNNKLFNYSCKIISDYEDESAYIITQYMNKNKLP